MYGKCRFCWREGVSVIKLVMELHILPVHFCILYEIPLTVFKCIHGSVPDYLKDLIVLSQPQTGLHTSNHVNHLVFLLFLKYCKAYNFKWLFSFIIVMTAIEKCGMKSFWHSFTESHFETFCL